MLAHAHLLDLKDLIDLTLEASLEQADMQAHALVIPVFGFLLLFEKHRLPGYQHARVAHVNLSLPMCVYKAPLVDGPKRPGAVLCVAARCRKVDAAARFCE